MSAANTSLSTPLEATLGFTKTDKLIVITVVVWVVCVLLISLAIHIYVKWGGGDRSQRLEAESPSEQMEMASFVEQTETSLVLTNERADLQVRQHLIAKRHQMLTTLMEE